MQLPLPIDVVEMFLTNDHELIQAFVLQCLDESFHVHPEMGRLGTVRFDIDAAPREYLVELPRISRIVVPLDDPGSEGHLLCHAQKVPSLLVDPLGMRTGGAGGDPTTSYPQMQENQKVEVGQSPCRPHLLCSEIVLPERISVAFQERDQESRPPCESEANSMSRRMFLTVRRKTLIPSLRSSPIRRV